MHRKVVLARKFYKPTIAADKHGFQGLIFSKFFVTSCLLETKFNHLDQYGRKNNLFRYGIQNSVHDDVQYSPDFDIIVKSRDIETWRMIGLTDKNNSKKTIIPLFNRRYCKKALLNRKKLTRINNAKYKSNAASKIFVNKKLSRTNQLIAYNRRKLKRAEMNHSCCSKDGVIYIKNTDQKIHHIKMHCELFPEFSFSNDEKHL